MGVLYVFLEIFQGDRFEMPRSLIIIATDFSQSDTELTTYTGALMARSIKDTVFEGTVSSMD